MVVMVQGQGIVAPLDWNQIPNTRCLQFHTVKSELLCQFRACAFLGRGEFWCLPLRWLLLRLGALSLNPRLTTSNDGVGVIFYCSLSSEQTAVRWCFWPLLSNVDTDVAAVCHVFSLSHCKRQFSNVTKIVNLSPLVLQDILWHVSKFVKILKRVNQCCPTFLCTRAQFTDAYGGASATTLLLIIIMWKYLTVLRHSRMFFCLKIWININNRLK
jgi:hypothetical protein